MNPLTHEMKTTAPLSSFSSYQSVLCTCGMSINISQTNVYNSTDIQHVSNDVVLMSNEVHNLRMRVFALEHIMDHILEAFSVIRESLIVVRSKK